MVRCTDVMSIDVRGAREVVVVVGIYGTGYVTNAVGLAFGGDLLWRRS